MRSNTAQTASVARRPRNRGDPHQTVVWVRGEHDISTRDRLAGKLAEAASRDAADIVVDLSGITFMDASTIGALVAARNNLRVHSRSLTFRHPSPAAQRLLDLCGLAPLTDGRAPTIGSALGTWVSVPARDRNRNPAAQPQVRPELPAQDPADVAVERAAKPARSSLKSRALP
jgi:anti-sigma B factor antagonist